MITTPTSLLDIMLIHNLQFMTTKDLIRAATPNITCWGSEVYRLSSSFYLFVARLITDI